MLCQCDTQLLFDECCGPFLTRLSNPPTPLALMRSRYSAYVLSDFDYLIATMRGKASRLFDKERAENQKIHTEWLRLEIIDAPIPLPNAREGFVEFKAFYLWDGEEKCIHERSRFVKRKDKWYYIDGTHRPGI